MQRLQRADVGCRGTYAPRWCISRRFITDRVDVGLAAHAPRDDERRERPTRLHQLLRRQKALKSVQVGVASRHERAPEGSPGPTPQGHGRARTPAAFWRRAVRQVSMRKPTMKKKDDEEQG